MPMVGPILDLLKHERMEILSLQNVVSTDKQRKKLLYKWTVPVVSNEHYAAKQHLYLELTRLVILYLFKETEMHELKRTDGNEAHVLLDSKVRRLPGVSLLEHQFAYLPSG